MSTTARTTTGITTTDPTTADPTASAPGSPLRFDHVGFGDDLVEYQHAWELQRELHDRVVSGDAPDTVLLLEHEPVYTAGKRTARYERPVDGTPVVDVDRGGRITWHGPGQLVGYPIVQLAQPLDVVEYVRRLESALIGVCAEYGLRTMRVEGRTGVWVPADERGRERKIAAIGVRVSRGATMHGFALNCNPDLSWFTRIVPCGINDADVTSLSAELGRDVPVREVLPLAERHLLAVDLPGHTMHTRSEETDPAPA
jgi:lipoyl(octanoyl) transferase